MLICERENCQYLSVFVRLCFNVTNLLKVFCMLTHLVTDNNDYIQEILLGLKREKDDLAVNPPVWEIRYNLV